VAALLVWTDSAAAAPAAIDVHISRPSLRQGEVTEVTVRTTTSLDRVSLRFAGRSWPLYPSGARAWRTLLGTDPTTAPRHHTLVVEASAANGDHTVVRRSITVIRVEFPKRYLTFDPDRLALLTPEKTAQERRRVAAALRELHPSPLWSGTMAMPVDGTVSSPYGVLNIYQGLRRGFHGGVDIAATEGTPVYAAEAGIVRLAEALPLSGNAVLLDHGLGVVTSYLHLSSLRVRAGQRVARGELLGHVGSTGLATGPHLHWGLRVNGVRVDPLAWTRR
jgi:murein DD-endopeptidase MepM/ murein hydrolase activator NlpD